MDTNVVLSALVFSGGSTALLRRRWQQRDFVPLVSTATAQELVRVLAYPKFGLDSSDREELLADYNLLAGRIWVMVLIVTLMTPIIAFTWRGL